MISKPPLGSRINKNHPLANGLVGCYLFNETGGDVIYDLTQSNNVTNSYLTRIINCAGFAGGINPTSQRITLPNLLFPSQYNFTVIASFIPLAATMKAGIVMNGTGGSKGWNIVIHNGGGSAGNKLTVTGEGISWDLFGGALGTITAGKEEVVALTNGATASWVAYRDGIYKAASSSSVIDSPTITQIFTWEDNNFALNYIYFYNRKLTAAEILNLYVNPYCFIAKPNLIRKIGSVITTAINKTNFFHGW